MNDFTTVINGNTLEYFDGEHIYLVDGVIVPSISQILKIRFGRKYEGVDPAILKMAADAGTAVHEAIERYCKTGVETNLPELRNFKFLQKAYGFEVVDNEVPVILYDLDEPLAAGRLDMVIRIGDCWGGADIKRTSQLDRDYLFYQLNLYRIAYNQSYGIKWDFLRGIHLKNDIRRFAEIPVNEYEAWELVAEWKNS